MEINVIFTFRNKAYSCTILIDSSAEPYYVFVDLLDTELLAIFGADLTIKTDFVRSLSGSDDADQLIEIRQVIFDTIKTMPEFIAAKSKAKLVKMYNNQN